MRTDRRKVLRSFVLLVAVFGLPRLLLAARPDKAFAATTADDAINEMFGATPEDGDAVRMKIPDIAENGAVVPVTVSTDLAGVESISVVVDSNPTPLAASFELSERSPASVSVRIKMRQSSNVRAIVKTAEGLYSTSKEVKVTIGGCGG